MSKVCFFTVTCAKDYDYLLGSIEHHAEMGRHLVLDTTPPEQAVKFPKVPDSVIWLHEPNFGSGWKEFRVISAVARAMMKAREVGSDVLVYMDSDEFFTKDSMDLVFPLAEKVMVELGVVHWKVDGKPYVFGPSEWHCRAWPANSEVEFPLNIGWQLHPKYDGNPERHPMAKAPLGLEVIRINGHFRHHVHYCFGPKATDEDTAIATISGWPDKGVEVAPVPWPEKLRLWKEQGIRPSESFR